MYCVKCGVELSKGTTICPLCNTKVLYEEDGEKEEFYPSYKKSKRKFNRQWIMLGFTITFLLLMVYMFLINIQINHAFTWSVYVIGGMAVFYLTVMLPLWFNKPNMVIFTPIAIASMITYSMLICILTKGHWFLTLVLPVGSMIMLLITALVALVKYCYRGIFFIVGGFFILVGVIVALLELFIWITFGGEFTFWFIYPLSSTLIVGLFIIFIGICKPFRDYLKKKLFI